MLIVLLCEVVVLQENLSKKTCHVPRKEHNAKIKEKTERKKFYACYFRKMCCKTNKTG